MAAGLTSAIQALVAHRDAQFLKRLSEDYSLDLAELTSKYLEAPPPAEKKKRVIKVKMTADGKEIRCQGQTAKKEQCSFGPLPGKCFCKRHLPAETPAPPAEQPAGDLPPIPEEDPYLRDMEESVKLMVHQVEELREAYQAIGRAEPESPEPAAAPEPEPEPFTVAEEDKVGFDQLSPLAPLKSLSDDDETQDPSTPRNLMDEMEQAMQEQYERAQQRAEEEQEALLAALRRQEEQEYVPYEPPAASPPSPSPVKAPPKRRQSSRPKVAKK
jgi:hypothetical protein